MNYTLRQTAWAAPQQISSHVQESQRNIKSKLAGVQRAMQLYLANKDTEFILFKPIRVSFLFKIYLGETTSSSFYIVQKIRKETFEKALNF